MKILVCIDGSEQSFKAVEKAAIIAAGLESPEVTLLNVQEVLARPSSKGVYFSDQTRAFWEKHEIEDRKERTEMLRKAAKFFEEKRIKVDTALVKGHPATSIADMVAQEGFDLVVIGNRGLSGMKKLILGSVSNAVAQEVKSSIFIVK